MKAKKSRVILSGVSLLLVLCLLVGGTMAWFTDTEKVDTNFTAGILDVSVKPGEEGKTALDFENLRPMLYENFYKELDKNEWNNDVTQGGTTGLKDSHYAPVPAYFKPVDITNEGTLPTKVKLSLEAGDGCEAGEPILTEDNITIKQDPEKVQDCENRLAPVLKVFVYKLVGEDWTLVEGVNLNTAYDEDAANPDGVASENTAEEANSTYMTAMIPANGTERYVIAGYLPETVGNAYQGQHYHGNLVLNAYQMDDTAAGNPDEGGSSSEDPDDPDRFNDNVTIEWRENTADGTPVQSRKVTVKSDTTIAAADYDAPQGYVYSPAAADQSSAVTVDDETGVATPATVVFTVVPEEAKTIEYVLYYQNTVNDQLLTETKKVSLEVPGEYTIATPDLAGRTVTITAPLPEGYVFDPAAQSFDVSVDADGVAAPTTVTFDVKPEGSGEEPGGDPDKDYNYSVTVQYKEGDSIRHTETESFSAKGDVTSYTINADLSWVTKYDNEYDSQSGNTQSRYMLASGQSGSQTVTLDPSTGTVTPNPVVFELQTGLYKSGDGSEENPYVVSSAIQFDNIRWSMNSHFVLDSSINLGSNENRGYFSTIGIGSATDTPFEGTLDGNGYTISNLKIDYGTDYINVGLFAINEGEIRNLIIETNGGIQAATDVGAVVGINRGKITNVHVNGTVGGLTSTDTNVGLICGHNESTGTITQCSSEGMAIGYTYVGGLVGFNEGTITESYSLAGVNSYVTVNNSFGVIGGLAGANNGRIENCYAIPAKTIQGYQYIGGLVGYQNFGSIKNCYSVANSKVYAALNAHLGVGYATSAGYRNISGLYYATTTGSGTVNGMTAISPSALQSGTTLSGFDTSVWSFNAGEYPNLINNRR